MVKYADISKNRTKPFSDDFETKVKAATKIAHADGKTSTTLKWDNGITAKVATKGTMDTPVADEVALTQTVEFTQSTYSLTSEFNKDCTNFQAVFKSGDKQEYTLRQAFGAITAIANYNVAGEKKNWKVSAAHEAAVSDDLAVQVGAEVNDAFKPDVSVAANVKNVGDFAVKTDLAEASSASIFDLAFLNAPFGYALTAGVQAKHSQGALVQEPAMLLVAKAKDHTIKAKVVDVLGAATPMVSYVMKAPVAMTATWTYKENKSAFGVNVSL